MGIMRLSDKFDMSPAKWEIRANILLLIWIKFGYIALERGIKVGMVMIVKH